MHNIYVMLKTTFEMEIIYAHFIEWKHRFKETKALAPNPMITKQQG